MFSWASLLSGLVSLANLLINLFKSEKDKQAGEAIQASKQQQVELDAIAKAKAASDTAAAKYDASKLPSGKPQPPDPYCRD